MPARRREPWPVPVPAPAPTPLLNLNFSRMKNVRSCRKYTENPPAVRVTRAEIHPDMHCIGILVEPEHPTEPLLFLSRVRMVSSYEGRNKKHAANANQIISSLSHKTPIIKHAVTPL